MVSMLEDREKSAGFINSLSKEALFAGYGITRVAEITGLDIIGAPVFQAVRPIGKVLGVNSGKSLERERARAGAIAEAIELPWRPEREQPNRGAPYRVCISSARAIRPGPRYPQGCSTFPRAAWAC